MNKEEKNQERTTYYDVLGVARTASRDEIKAAFRRQMKQKIRSDDCKEIPGDESRLREIMNAYRVLSNERERARYDLLLQTRPELERKKALSHRERSRRYAASLLSLLLSGKGREALEIYEEMGKTNFDIEKNMSKRDYLDCLFLIGEQLEKARRHKEAAQLYEDLFHREGKPPRNRYFFDEIEERLKKLYSRTLPQKPGTTPDQELQYYRRALDLNLNRGEEAFITKKIAEAYLKKNQTGKARDVLKKALSLKPDLKGTALIREELGFSGNNSNHARL